MTAMKITKTSTGLLRTVVYLGRDEDKKTVVKTITAKNKTALKVLADRAKFDFRDDKTASMAYAESFQKAAEEMIDSRDKLISPNTLKDYRSRLRILTACFPEFCESDINSMTTNQVQTLLNQLAAPHTGTFIRGRQSVETYQTLKGCSAKTISNYWGFIQTVLKYKGIKIDAPLLPQKEEPEIYVPSDAEMKEILAKAEGELSVCIRLAAFGPLREGEICALQLSDIKGTVVHVWRDIEYHEGGGYSVKNKPKTTKSNRYVEMPEDLIKDIRKQGYVTSYSPKQLRYYFGKLLKECGLPDFRFHDLRHYCVSTLHAQGIPDLYIMKRGGWSNDSTLKKVYKHTLADQDANLTKFIIQHFAQLNSQAI